MMGRYNSLFGVDLDVWKRMREMLKLCGVDRVVVNFAIVDWAFLNKKT